MAGPLIVTPQKPPAQQAAAQRVARYYNKASGKMETAQAMKAYRPSNNRGGSTTTRTTTERSNPTGQGLSLLQMTPAQIEARAKQIVQAEQRAERLPFQQQQTLLGQEQTGQLGANRQAQTNLAGTLSGLQNAQAGSAKTFENEAADRIAKAGQAAPGAAEAAERLGLKPGEKEPEAVQRQQEAARTLLSGIAQASASGTAARQQAESNFLTNIQATSAQAAGEKNQATEGEYARRKAEVSNKEAQQLARGEGRLGKLINSLLSEQQKQQIAAAGLGLKGQEFQRKSTETTSKVQAARSKERIEAGKLGVAKQNANSLAEYRKQQVAQKQRSLELGEKKYNLSVQKFINSTSGTNGSRPLTQAQKNTYASEMASAMAVFKHGISEGHTPAQIRSALESGQFRTIEERNGKEYGVNLKNGKVKNGVILDAIEQVVSQRYISAQTKNQLRELGLSDHGWSNLYYYGTVNAPGGRGAKGTVPVPGERPT